jgi:hypothetical protein
MSWSHASTLALAAVALAAACSDSSGPATTARLEAVTPVPGAVNVSTGTHVALVFGQPMMAGMEQYLDLHQGGVTGPVMPMSCVWSQDMATLTCTPGAPLAGGTQYTIHVGAGMTDAEGHRCGMGDWTAMGGQWATSGMMGGMHDGQPMGMMGSGWMQGDHYGMLFTFTTS